MNTQTHIQTKGHYNTLIPLALAQNSPSEIRSLMSFETVKTFQRHDEWLFVLQSGSCAIAQLSVGATDVKARMHACARIHYTIFEKRWWELTKHCGRVPVSQCEENVTHIQM